MFGIDGIVSWLGGPQHVDPLVALEAGRGINPPVEEDRVGIAAGLFGKFKGCVGYVASGAYKGVHAAVGAAAYVPEMAIKHCFMGYKNELMQSLTPKAVLVQPVIGDDLLPVLDADGKPLLEEIKSLPQFLNRDVFRWIPNWLRPVLGMLGFGENWRNGLIANLQDNLGRVFEEDNFKRLGIRGIEEMTKVIEAHTESNEGTSDSEFLSKLGIDIGNKSVEEWKAAINDKCSERIGRLLVKKPAFEIDGCLLRRTRVFFGRRIIKFIRMKWYSFVLLFRSCLVKNVTKNCFPILPEVLKLIKKALPAADAVAEEQQEESFLGSMLRVMGIKDELEHMVNSLGKHGDVLFYYMLYQVIDEIEKVVETPDAEAPAEGAVRNEYLRMHEANMAFVRKIEHDVNQGPSLSAVAVLDILSKQGDSSSMFDVATPVLSKFRENWKGWIAADRPE